jgi:hypothetical protein
VARILAKLKVKNYRRNFDADMKSFGELKNKMKSSSMLTKIKKVDMTKLVQAGIIAKTVGISGAVSFIVFLMIEVIWGSQFATSIPVIRTIAQSQFWIELILLVGLFAGLGISIIVFIIYGSQKDITGTIKVQVRKMLSSAGWAAFVTFIVLVAISLIAVYTYDPGIFLGLTLIEWFGIFLEVIADFVTFVYKYPALFWLYTIVIYYVILTVFFVMIVPRSEAHDARKRRRKIDEIRTRFNGEKCPPKKKKSDIRERFDVSIFLR